MQTIVKTINRMANDFEDIKNNDGPIPIYLDIGEVFLAQHFMGTKVPKVSVRLKGISLIPFPSSSSKTLVG